MARDYWLALLRDRIFNADLDMPRETQLEASLQQSSFGPLRVSWVDSVVPRMLMPADAGVSASGERDVLLMVMDTPSEWALRGGREGFELAPGDVVCGDFRRGFEMRRPGRARTLSLSLSASWLRTWVPQAEFEQPQVLGGPSGWSSVLALLLRQIQPQRVLELDTRSELLASQLGSLLALALHERQPGSARQLEPDQLARLAQAFIQRSFGKPGLSAAEVAGELGISERTLHRALSREGASFSARLHAERMGVADRLLRDRHFRTLSVAEIGRRVGFSDPSHFVRRFRAEFGVTPAALRRRLLDEEPS
jgi:AraC-like DNA-binding protein